MRERERERERQRAREGEIWVQLDLGMLVWVQIWNRLRERILVSSLFQTTGGDTVLPHCKVWTYKTLLILKRKREKMKKKKNKKTKQNEKEFLLGLESSRIL